MTLSLKPLSFFRIARHASSSPSSSMLPMRHRPWLMRMQQATTLRLFRALAALSGIGLLGLLSVELWVVDLPAADWLIEWLLLGVTAYVYVVALINGVWDAQKQRMELDPMISLLIIALLMLLAVAYIRTAIYGEVTRMPYYEVLGIAVAILLATTLIAYIER